MGITTANAVTKHKSHPSKPPTPAPTPGPSADELKARREAYEAERSRYPDRVHIFLDDNRYYHIDQAGAAHMLGYFTQKLKMDGFPWELRADRKICGFSAPRALSEMEALQRLSAGEEVLFQPKRVIDLNLTPEGLGSLALLGTPMGTAAAATAASLTKQANMKVEGAGREIPYGKPVPVHSFGELKLLHEMYSAQSNSSPDSVIADTSAKVAFFTMKRHNTPYPFAFYKASPGSRFTQALKSSTGGATAGLAIGALAGLVLQGPVGTAIGVQMGVLAGAFLGAVGSGLYHGAKALFAPQSKQEINAFEAVDRITRGETVIFQEKKMHSASVLIGKLTYFTDYGRGSELKGKADLDIFHALQNQWPDDENAPDASQKKPASH